MKTATYNHRLSKTDLALLERVARSEFGGNKSRALRQLVKRKAISAGLVEPEEITAMLLESEESRASD